MSERGAVKKLSGPKKRTCPYRREGQFASTKEPQNREDAAWARLEKTKKRGNHLRYLGYAPQSD